MVFLLRVCRGTGVRPPASGATNYTQPCNFVINRRLIEVCRTMRHGDPHAENCRGGSAADIAAVYAGFVRYGLVSDHAAAVPRKGVAQESKKSS